MASKCKYRFAFETVVWGRHILDLDAVLLGISACGYDGVEFAQDPAQIFIREGNDKSGRMRFRKLKDISELLGKLSHYKLELVSLAGGPLIERMIFCGKTYRPPYLYVDDWNRMSARATVKFRNWPAFSFGLHPHWFLAVQRGTQAIEIIQKFNKGRGDRTGLALLPDTAHLTIVDENPVEIVSDRSLPLAGVHLKDWRPSYGRYSRRYAQGFTRLGNGVVKIREVLQALDQRGFDGWVTVEQDTAEETPLQSAMHCARWLVGENRMTIPNESRLADAIEQESYPLTPELPKSFAAHHLVIMDHILPAATGGPAAFHQAVADVLLGLPGVEAVQLFNYSSRDEELYLLAMSGVKKLELCRTVFSAAVGPFRQAIRDHNVTWLGLTDPRVKAGFHDPELLQYLKGQRMCIVPIFNTANAHHLDHLLCLYYSGRLLLSDVELEHIASGVARAADFMADDVCSAAAAEASWVCGRSSSRAEFLERFHRLLMKQFRCEGASIFLVDETGRRLCPAYAPGLSWRSDIPKHKQYYELGQGMTGKFWQAGEMRLLSGKDGSQSAVQSMREDRSLDFRTSAERDECLIAPLARLGGKVRGIVRLLNKTPGNLTRSATAFSDDDAARMDAITQAALPYLELLIAQEQQKQALSRMVHEFQTPLVAIRASVDYIQEELRRRERDPSTFFSEDYLDDILQWSQLMGRLTLNAQVFGGMRVRPSCGKEKTLLLADVIAPAMYQIKPLIRRGQRPVFSNSSFSEIPALWIDRHQFQQVFLNLLANSIKYGGTDSKIDISITGGRQGNSFLIWFSDRGRGIEDGLEELIFLPGFRSEDARLTDVSGQGIGLMVVRSIIEAHGGSIRVSSKRNPTTFEIALPISLRYNAPALLHD